MKERSDFAPEKLRKDMMNDMEILEILGDPAMHIMLQQISSCAPIREAGYEQGQLSPPSTLAVHLKKKLDALHATLQLVTISCAVDVAMNSKQPTEVPNTNWEYEDNTALQQHVDAAEQTATSGIHINRQLAEDSRQAAKELEKMSLLASHAGKRMLLNPGEVTADANC